jgi:uncharacterized iron-regulated membrane protein
MSFIHRPQTVFWRKATFQVHLWTGVVLCLYMIVVGVSGSILVFERELGHLTFAKQWKASPASGRSIEFPDAVGVIASTFPEYQISAGYPPDQPGLNFEFLLRRGRQTRDVFLDAGTGRIAGEIDPAHSWIAWTIDLHFHLLGGRAGEAVNGVGAACLLLLCLTGLIVWWPGVRSWTRGLKINLRASWKRVNYDLHSAVGFWTLLVMVMWAFTGVYLVWSDPIEALVNRFSSVASANRPVVPVSPRGKAQWADLGQMIRTAQQASPRATFEGAFFPADNSSALILLMAREEQRNFRQSDYIFFDPATGKQLSLWHRGMSDTWGARFIALLTPLHFGYDWGLTVKIVWAVLGFALPLLSVTGVLMYWNRSLSKKWSALSGKNYSGTIP